MEASRTSATDDGQSLELRELLAALPARACRERLAPLVAGAELSFPNLASPRVDRASWRRGSTVSFIQSKGLDWRDVRDDGARRKVSFARTTDEGTEPIET